MPTLDELASGLPNQSCGTNQPISQKVQIVPYSSTANCQQTGPINPSKRSVPVTVQNLIVDACGVIRVHFDHDASASDDQLVAFGGPVNIENRATMFPYYGRWDAFGASGSLANVEGGPAIAAGSTYGYDSGVLLINAFAANGNALVVSNVSMVRADLSDASTLELSNNPITPFYVNNTSTYNVETSGATIYASQTSVGSSNTAVDLTWCLGAGIPLTFTTGFEIEIPGGFEGDLELCIAQSEKNIDFSEGC